MLKDEMGEILHFKYTDFQNINLFGFNWCIAQYKAVHKEYFSIPFFILQLQEKIMTRF